MAFVITQNCCNDSSCVPVCPVDCIRPVTATSDDAATMLYIDPVACVDCGACMAECPVGAIYYEDDLPAGQQPFKQLNADYFARNPLRVRHSAPRPADPGVEAGSLRVAIVGSGPAACYAAAELMRIDGAEVSVIERLPSPFGLIRAGVAPDHQRTKAVVSAFEPALAHDGASCFFNVTVGQDVSHEELLEYHHAVIYAVGTSASRELGIPGEHLPGSHSAAEFVAWYNNHPEHGDDEFHLATTRVVVVGNGNVALDIGRVLLGDRETLAATDIAEHALTRLAESSVSEVVLLARRGAAHAAFSVGEFLALAELPGVDVIIEGEVGAAPVGDFEAAAKYDAVLGYRDRPPTPGHKRLVFRFGVTPVEILGSQTVEGIRIVTTGCAPEADGEILSTGLVLRSIGYRGEPVPGIPFDAERGIVPNDHGRVLDGDRLCDRVYVAGWIKRGPRGVIGTNRRCAEETVGALIQDYRSGRLATPVVTGFAKFLAQRGIRVVDWQGWQRIDAAEKRRGADEARPRMKFTDVREMLQVADG